MNRLFQGKNCIKAWKVMELHIKPNKKRDGMDE